MSAEAYIAEYGANLTDAEKRYIMAFGPPQGFIAGPSRTPSTPGQTVAAAPTLERSAAELEREARLEEADLVNRQAQEMMDEEEAAAFGEL